MRDLEHFLRPSNLSIWRMVDLTFILPRFTDNVNFASSCIHSSSLPESLSTPGQVIILILA